MGFLLFRLWRLLGWMLPLWLWRVFLDTDLFGEMAINPRLELINQSALWGCYVTAVLWPLSWIAMVVLTVEKRTEASKHHLNGPP